MDAVAIAAAIGAFAGALVGLGAIVRSTYRAWRKVDGFLSDWNGEARPGHPAIPSMPERVQTLEGKVESIQKQVTPNGGNTQSLGDRVVRIESHITPPKE